MLDVGRVCVKIAGRHAGKQCVVVEAIDKNFVLVDGEMKRKRCNLFHLEPTSQTLKIKQGASHAEVAKAFETLNIKLTATKPRTKKAEKPARVRKVREKPAPTETKKTAEKPAKTAKPKAVKKK